MKEFSITIIIPVYKVEAYILECLESVANQDMTHGIECILVDDCGGDNSIEIAKHYIDNYKGNIVFRILTHEFNKGLSAARNTALKVCRGKYVFFLDSDDKLFPTSMRDLWDIAEKHKGVDIVQGLMVRGDKPFDMIKTSFPEYTNDVRWIRNKLCGLSIMDAACNRLVRKDFIISNSLFFLEGHTQEDSIWTYDIQKHINSFAFCKKVTYYYRETPNSIMTSLTREKKAKDYARVHNIAFNKMIHTTISPCEVKHLALLSAISIKEIGFDAIKYLDNRNNKFSVLLYKLQYTRVATKSIVNKIILEFILRLYYKFLSNRWLFMYNLNN